MCRVARIGGHQVVARLLTVAGSAGAIGGVKVSAVVAWMVLFRADAAFYAAEVVAA